jgi:tetratricopeptide (TPR) repeat protein
MMLAWTGLPVTQEDLVSQVYTPGREGTLRTDVLAAARRNGRLAISVTNLSDMLSEIAAGHPVLVFQNLGLSWYSQWHFAVAIAYDLDAGKIVLHSGVEERRITPLKTFERTWARGDYWALVILPPGVLPANPDVQAVLKAAASLERVRRYSEAASIYQTAAERWPENFGALMGLGNARYALGDLAESQKAFQRAVQSHPEEPGGWNNLAHVLGRMGRKDEALQAAREAVRLGGKDVETYRETLREVSDG